MTAPHNPQPGSFNVPGDLIRQEGVVRELRQRYQHVDGDSRPTAALSLCGAIADLVVMLPADNPHRGDLAAEGLVLLGEAFPDGNQPGGRWVVTVREQLTSANAGTSAREPGQPPRDIGLDADWEALRGPMQGARQVVSMMSTFARLLPSQAPERQALTSFAAVLSGVERGERGQGQDAALEAAIRQAQAAGLDSGLVAALILMRLDGRMQQCQEAEQAGNPPGWPSLDEVDQVIAALESSAELASPLGGQFQAVDGIHHMYIANAIMTRLVLDRKRQTPRDSVWREVTLGLLSKLTDHLQQVPPALGAPVEQLRAKTAEIYTVVSQTPVPPGTASEAPPGPVSSPRPTATPDFSEPPSQPGLASVPASEAPAADLIPDVLFGQVAVDFGQLSPGFLEGMSVLADHGDGPLLKWMRTMLLILKASLSQRWAKEDDARLEELLREARRDGFFRPGEVLTKDGEDTVRILTAVMLALGDATRLQRRAASSPPQERPSVGELTAVVTEAESALALVAGLAASRPVPGAGEITAVLRAKVAMLLRDLAQAGGEPKAEILARASAHFEQLPPELLRQLPLIADAAVLHELDRGQITPDDPSVASVIDRNWNTWDEAGGDLPSALAAAGRAGESRTREDIEAAIEKLRMVSMGLPPGSPLSAQVLAPLAGLQLALGATVGHPAFMLDGVATAIEAVRVAAPTHVRPAARMLNSALSLLAHGGLVQGPVGDAELVLRAALDRSSMDDRGLRAVLTVGIGAAVGLSAARLNEKALAGESRRLTDEAERLIASAPADASREAAAHDLHMWITAQDQLSSRAGKTAAGQGAMPDALEAARLARQAVRRAKVIVDPAVDPSPRYQPPDQAALRSVVADLHQALAGYPDDTRLCRQANRYLGICQAELHWAGQGEGTLTDAIFHLQQALLSGEHATPTQEWASLLATLARCYREAARSGDDPEMGTRAERAARGALREFARCVLIAATTREATAIATQANEIAAEAVGWCLADGRPRAAIDIAESGRGLVLASVVVSGQAEEILRRAGEHAAADAWREGAPDHQAKALEALWGTPTVRALLTAPIGEVIAARMLAMRLDALVYLVPPAHPAQASEPATADGTGHAIVLRSVTAQVEVVALPGLASLDGTPLADYLAAFQAALAEDTGAEGTAFRGGPRRQAWSSALGNLGRWSHDTIMGPLIAHTRGWGLDHPPHLALIPLGRLAAIPYAAAWTDDPAVEGTGHAGQPTGSAETTRRYAIDDVVLSYAASARLLGEVSGRPRQQLDERVVLVADPSGGLAMSRRATRDLGRLYRHAEIYGTKKAPNGPATMAALLGMLPAADRPGASLLHLTTHGKTRPEPGLQATDGWLSLDSILNQARGRAADAPGGLVITNACLTDSTLASYDESLTIATAFLAAGATAVIGTRWPVTDATTAILAARLHSHLQRGYPPAEALRRAQLDLLRPGPQLREGMAPHLAAEEDSSLSDLASWAGYVHHGI